MRIRQLRDYWQSIHPGGGRLPGRQHLEPIDMPELLRWLVLIDVERQPLRFRYRLIGTGHHRALGRDPTGRWLDDAPDRFQGGGDKADFAAAADGAPRYCRPTPTSSGGEGHVLIERLLLPLARDGASVDMLLAIALYADGGGAVL